LHVGIVNDESFGTCSQVMSALEQVAMCSNRKLIRKMEKASQGCKRAKRLSDEMRITLSTTIYCNKVPTKKKKTIQKTRRMESLINFYVKKRL
jgi:hypothetical protein